ncbi:type II toxin-antitoxin system VapC family toxin [Phormidesmis sp. 146-35]
MRILIDTNIVLDVLLDRAPFVEEGVTLFEMVERQQVQGYIAATTVTNVFYIVRKAQGQNTALDAVHRILTALELCSVDRAVIEQAIESGLKDFEDGVQFACAQLNQMDAIVTRGCFAVALCANRNDFSGVALPIWSIAELRVRL